MIRSFRRRWLALGLATVLLAAMPAAATASHSWGSYHWGRQSNPFTLLVGDNLSATWDSYLDTSVSDWSQSNVLDLKEVAGGTKPKACRPTTGRVEVCNAFYGNNGWLGVAQIWVQGGHIVQGLVKVNDTYYSTPTYNTPAWRNLVMCQEIGHTLGLDHQDENFNNPNLGTCMDYTSSPASNQHPNSHDYQQLAAIYAHTDSVTTVGTEGSGGKGRGKGASDWGRAIRTAPDGGSSIFVAPAGTNRQVFTFVVWAR